jgi:hypothetical protein
VEAQRVQLGPSTALKEPDLQTQVLEAVRSALEPQVRHWVERSPEQVRQLWWHARHTYSGVRI